MKLDVDHPAIKEMISSRAGGNPDYVAGVRAYLTEGKEPPQESIAYKGYLDAHDMSQRLSEIHADLLADELEEDMKLKAARRVLREEKPLSIRKPAEVPKPPIQIERKPSYRIRL